MPNEENQFTNQDREILITLKAQVQRVISDVQTMTNNFVDKTEHYVLAKRVEALEANNTWVVRLIVGMVVTALVGTILIIKT